MADLVKDPVCGMEIDPKTAAGQSEFKGQIYYFCSYGCKKAFDKEPEKYVAKQGTHNQIPQILYFVGIMACYWRSKDRLLCVLWDTRYIAVIGLLSLLY